MAYKNGNYSAFYVSEPFSEINLGASATKDFLYYNLLRAWKAKDITFPFNDSHNKNYNVRDGSNWEKTLKPRLRDRLNNSKNIILFLSSRTKNSRALREEIEYGIMIKGLPVIVVYPELLNKNDIINCGSNTIKESVKKMWDNIPVLRDYMNQVPTLHIPYDKEIIRMALNDNDFMLSTKCEENVYFYKC